MKRQRDNRLIRPWSKARRTARCPIAAKRLSVELLEGRMLLAGDTCRHDTTDPNDDAPAASLASVASLAADDTFHIAEAGSTFATAYDLGTLGATQSFGGAVGGIDTADLMRFTLTAQSRVSIGLSGLSADIDLSLYNSLGQRLGLSNRGGAASESISQTLAAGTYYIAAIPWRSAASTYVLTVGAAPTQVVAPTPTTPAPTTPATPTAPTTPTTPTTPTIPTTPTVPATPTTPTTPVTSFPDVAYFGGSNDWNLNSINAPEAWAQGYTGQGVTVAVVDTGVDMSHPDLLSQLWVNAGEIAGNGIDDDHNGYIDDRYGWDFASGDNNPSDGNGHGTHVAGTIAAANNGTGSTGVAPGAKIMPVRVLGNDGSGTAANVAAGIRYAAQNGADVVNLSLGGALSSVIQTAIQYATQLGSLVVVAAGNESASAPSYPARFSASLSGVISVGAYSSSNALAGFSNRVGPSGAVQVDAPGVNIYSTYAGDGYGRLSGTSMATPHVAGLAALALSASPDLTPSQLRTVIVNGANHTISASDSHGGINAAVTVALAAAGQTSATATASTAAQSLAAAQWISVRRFIARSTAGVDGALAQFAAATDRHDALHDTSQTAILLAPHATSQQVAKARDQALQAFSWADEVGFDLSFKDDEEGLADSSDPLLESLGAV